MELLGRFELPTSSLPNIYRLFFLVAACRTLFLETVDTTMLSGFHCCFLL
jgi:hypothetical protein